MWSLSLFLESAKTPVVGSYETDFPSIDPTRSLAGPLPSGYSLDNYHHHLGVSQPIVPSTSFDDLRGTAYSDSGHGLSSDSPGRRTTHAPQLSIHVLSKSPEVIDNCALEPEEVRQSQKVTIDYCRKSHTFHTN